MNEPKLVREEGEPYGNGELHEQKLYGEWEVHWEGALHRKRVPHGKGELHK